MSEIKFYLLLLTYLAGKYDTNQKLKKADHFWKKGFSVRHFTLVLTTAEEISKNKGNNPDKMCQLIFLKIDPQ